MAKAKSKLAPKSKDDLQTIVSTAVKAAVDHMQQTIVPNRLQAQRYFDGEVDIGEDEGRSHVVATKVRDTVRAVKPSLQRIFMSHRYPVEFEPVSDDDVLGSIQATQWCAYKYRALGGNKIMRSVHHDALLKKKGFVKVMWEDVEKTTIHTFSALTQDEYELLLGEDGIEVIEHSEYPATDVDEMGQMIPVLHHDLKLSRTVTKGQMSLAAMAPEGFFIDADAVDFDNFTVCGHSEDMIVADIVAMGYDFDEIEGLGVIDDADEEKEERSKSGKFGREEEPADPALQRVTLTEAYMRVDVDGTGKAVLHRFTLAGTGYKLLDWAPVDDVPIADFEIDPEPHSFWGRSVYDLIKNEQDASTSVLRGILDNVRQVNMPRTAILEGSVNIDDLLNNEVGGVVRERVSGAVRDLTTPFVAGQTLPALQYLDNMVEEKTGVTKASQGLDADALQSSTKMAVNATISAAAGQVEVMASNLAEGGMMRLFKLMLKMMVKHATKEELIRLNGSFVPVDPRDWNVDMDMVANVGLGTGRTEEKMIVLDQVLAFQQTVMQAYGPSNGMVSMTNVRDTWADKLALAGYRNADRYLQPMNPQKEEQLLAAQRAAAQQAAQGQQDPNAAIVQIEELKAQLRSQSDEAKRQLDAQKKQADVSLRASEIALTDDRMRDKMAQDLEIARTEIYAKYGVQMNTAMLKMEQEQQRMPAQQGPM